MTRMNAYVMLLASAVPISLLACGRNPYRPPETGQDQRPKVEIQNSQKNPPWGKMSEVTDWYVVLPNKFGGPAIRKPVSKTNIEQLANILGFIKWEKSPTKPEDLRLATNEYADFSSKSITFSLLSSRYGIAIVNNAEVWTCEDTDGLRNFILGL
jgi:hypothetical protein